MLKATDNPPADPPQDSSIGDLAGKLAEEAKAYARAEADVARAIATEKVNAVKMPLALIVVSVFVAMGALNALCVAIFVGLAMLMSPVLAGIVAFILIGAVAALLAWVGVSKLRSAL